MHDERMARTLRAIGSVNMNSESGLMSIRKMPVTSRYSQNDAVGEGVGGRGAAAKDWASSHKYSLRVQSTES